MIDPTREQIDADMASLGLRWPHDTPLKYIAHSTTGKTLTIDPPLINVTESFTRSNGTIIARLYERLTKAARRGGTGYPYTKTVSEAYRRGVLDAYNALRYELTT